MKHYSKYVFTYYRFEQNVYVVSAFYPLDRTGPYGLKTLGRYFLFVAHPSTWMLFNSIHTLKPYIWDSEPPTPILSKPFIFQLIECKSDLKQYQSKTQDVERELHFLRTQCKKIESERTELSTELGNCLKERNRLVGRTAELEKLTRYDKQGE